MKRQSSESVVEDSDERHLNHHRTQKEEDFASRVLKRQASSKVSDAILAATDDEIDCRCYVYETTSPLPNGALPVLDEQRSDFGPSVRQVLTRDEYRNARGILTSKLPDSKEVHATRPSAHRTGLVFARSPKHYDPSNPLHKEREQRIASVERALGDACLLGKCHVVAPAASMDDERTSKADGRSNLSLLSRTLLSEQDIAKVHRPAYLKR
jgi:hypothetical protein